MLDGGAGARGVRGRHRGDALVERHAWVDDDERIAVPQERGELVVRLLGKHQDRSVRRPMHQPVDERDRAVVQMEGRRQHHAHVLLVERLRRTGENVREVGGLDDRQSHPDEAGAPAREGARAPVRAEMLVADGAQHGRARRGGDVGPAVQDPRDGGDRHAGGARHLADCRTRLESMLLGLRHGAYIAHLSRKRLRFSSPKRVGTQS